MAESWVLLRCDDHRSDVDAGPNPSGGCSACLSAASTTCDFDDSPAIIPTECTAGAFAQLPMPRHFEPVRMTHLASHARTEERLHMMHIADSCCVPVRIIPCESATRVVAPATSLETTTQMLMVDHKRLPTRVVVDMTQQLLRAISYACDLRVSHLHINPASILVNFPSRCIQLAGWGDVDPRLTRYSAPCLFLSSVSVVRQHAKADVWSLGVVVAEALRGAPLIAMRGAPGCDDAHRILGGLFRALGTPSLAAIAVLDPMASAHGFVLPRVIKRPHPSKLLRNSHADREFTRIMYEMLDWDPRTRPSATSILRLPFYTRDPTLDAIRTGPARRMLPQPAVVRRLSIIIEEQCVESLDTSPPPPPKKRKDGTCKSKNRMRDTEPGRPMKTCF